MAKRAGLTLAAGSRPTISCPSTRSCRCPPPPRGFFGPRDSRNGLRGEVMASSSLRLPKDFDLRDLDLDILRASTHDSIGSPAPAVVVSSSILFPSSDSRTLDGRGRSVAVLP